MYTMNFFELKSRDVYEFSYAKNFSEPENTEHWSEDSIYVSDENFYRISKYIDRHISNFHYYGPAFKMNYDLWQKIEKDALAEEQDKNLFVFFEEINIWIKKIDSPDCFFWILGL